MAESSKDNTPQSQAGATSKFVRKEEEKIKRRRREKLQRLSNKIREFIEEEPEIPVVFLFTLNGKTEGQVSPWLRDSSHIFAEKINSASLEHHADMLLSAKEYQVPALHEDWKQMLSLHASETPDAVLRRILPLVVRGIMKGKNIWKGEKPEGWPIDIPYQDPNRTINNKKLSAENLRKVFSSLQAAYHIEIPEHQHSSMPEDTCMSTFSEKEKFSTYQIENMMTKGKFSEVCKLLRLSPAPDVVASIVATHSSSKILRHGFWGPKSFPLALLQPSTVKRDGQARLIPCKTLEECLNMYSPCGPAQLDLLCQVHGLLHIGHYIQQYERILSSETSSQLEEIYSILQIEGREDLYESFKDALQQPSGHFRLLLLAGALELNISLKYEQGSTFSFPPCPCSSPARSTLAIVSKDDLFSLSVPVSFIAGYKKSTNESPICVEKYRLPGMDKNVHRIEMGIDLYEADLRSLGPMRWLTDAVIDVVSRRLSEQLNTAAGNVFVYDTQFAQKLLAKGELKQRPLDLSGCNILAVEDVLTRANFRIVDGSILIVPISNMIHWYLAVFCAKSRTLSFLCSMNGQYKNEGASLKLYFEKELEKIGIVDTVQVRHMQVQQQKNSFDCGIFLLSFLKNILQTQSTSHLQTAVILTRNEVANLCLNV